VDGPVRPCLRPENQGDCSRRAAELPTGVAFQSGEVRVSWHDDLGAWCRRLFVSRTDEVAVLQLVPAGPAQLDCSVRLSPTPGPLDTAGLSSLPFRESRRPIGSMSVPSLATERSSDIQTVAALSDTRRPREWLLTVVRSSQSRSKSELAAPIE